MSLMARISIGSKSSALCAGLSGRGPTTISLPATAVIRKPYPASFQPPGFERSPRCRGYVGGEIIDLTGHTLDRAPAGLPGGRWSVTFLRDAFVCRHSPRQVVRDGVLVGDVHRATAERNNASPARDKAMTIQMRLRQDIGIFDF